MSHEERQLKAIEASLRRSFAVPDLKGVTDAIHAACETAARETERPDSGSTNGTRWFAVAAAILLYVGAGWTLLRGTELDPGMKTDWSQLYARSVGEIQYAQSGFDATPVACKTPDDLARSCQGRLGHGLELQPSPNVILHGEQPAEGFEDCVLLVGQADDAYVVCLIALQENDPRPRLSSSELKIHRVEIGPLVAYEFSDLDEAVLAPLLRVR